MRRSAPGRGFLKVVKGGRGIAALWGGGEFGRYRREDQVTRVRGGGVDKTLKKEIRMHVRGTDKSNRSGSTKGSHVKEKASNGRSSLMSLGKTTERTAKIGCSRDHGPDQ